MDNELIPTIGMEVHVELATHTKMFCNCEHRALELQPNESACPVCLGLPGSLPVVNAEAMRLGIRAAIALNCKIAETAVFERKNYMYPDLVKGYQISQFEEPLGSFGSIDILADDGVSIRQVKIRRVHLEEDTAKLIHTGNRTLVDVNRSSAPLMEIVTEPVLHSARDAEEYVRRLRAILVYWGVSRCRIERGEMRVEANVSVAPAGQLGVRTEIKNQAGFSHMAEAIQYEVQRHIDIIRSGGQVRQQTMGWDNDKHATFPQRDKENAHDYRYFPDPDLPTIRVDQDLVAKERQAMAEPLSVWQKRLTDAGVEQKELDALARQDALQFLRQATAVNENILPGLLKWIRKDVFALSNDRAVPIPDSKLTAKNFSDTVNLVESGKINPEAARKMLATLFDQGGDAETLAKEGGYFRIEDAGAVTQAVQETLAERADMVEQYRSGKTAVKNALLGMAMKKMNRRGDPKAIAAELDRLLR